MLLDGWHSLIAGRIALIERVKSGNWVVRGNEEDKQQREALAARGYWQAFQAVKNNMHKIFDGENAGKFAK